MRRLLVVTALSFLLLSSLAPPASGAAGDLDTSFSGDGKVALQLRPGEASSLGAAARWPNGRILAAGRVGASGDEDFAVLRLRRKGGLDTSFGGGDGVATVDLGDDDGIAFVGRDPKGRIVAVGWSEASGASRFAVARLLPGGALDGSFSGDGKKITAVGPIASGALTGAIDARGRILAAGWTQTSQSPDRERMAVIRYRPGGGLDRTFGKNGVVKPRTGGTSDFAWDMAIDRAGRIVLVGLWTPTSGGPTKWAILRLRPDGRPDRTFSGDGKLLLKGWPGAAGSDGGRAYAVAIDRRDRIVVAGYQTFGPSARVAVARLRADGRWDRTFSGDGRKAFLADGAIAEADAVMFDANGRILLAGYTYASDVMTARLRPRGGFDNSFGGNGVVTVDLSGGFDYGNDAFLDGSGRIVVAGTDYGFTPNRATVVRFRTG